MSKRQALLVFIVLSAFGVTIAILGVASGYLPLPIAVMTALLGFVTGLAVTRSPSMGAVLR